MRTVIGITTKDMKLTKDKILLRVPSCSSRLVRGSQSSGTTALVCQQHVRPAMSPTLRLRVRSVPQLIAIRPSRLATAIDERLHRLRRVYQRIPIERGIC